jgi:hypothetical protein
MRRSHIATGTMPTKRAGNTDLNMPSKDMMASNKTRTQRPLKRLENSSMLLSKFKATDDGSRERRRRPNTPLSTAESSSTANGDTDSANDDENAEWHDAGSGSDTDDTLARIEYWSSPRRKLKKPQVKANPTTPRTLRATRRNQDRDREPPSKPLGLNSDSVSHLEARLQDCFISSPSGASGNDKTSPTPVVPISCGVSDIQATLQDCLISRPSTSSGSDKEAQLIQ